jgi:hypothetical protein
VDPDGIDPVQQNGDYLLEVPDNRLVKIKSDKCLHEWTHRIAIYQDGTKIKVNEPTDTEIALRGGGSSGGNGEQASHRYYVGDAAGHDAWLAERQ